MPDDYRLNGVDRRLSSVEKDLYRGNGKPGITIRLAVLEECVDKIDETIKGMSDRLDKSNRKQDRLTWLVAVGVGIVITMQFVLTFAVKIKP